MILDVGGCDKLADEVLTGEVDSFQLSNLAVLRGYPDVPTYA